MVDMEFLNRTPSWTHPSQSQQVSEYNNKNNNNNKGLKLTAYKKVKLLAKKIDTVPSP